MGAFVDGKILMARNGGATRRHAVPDQSRTQTFQLLLKTIEWCPFINIGALLDEMKII